MSTFALRQADLIRVLQSRNTKYVILAINLLLVVWIASQLTSLTWGLLSPQETVSPVVAQPAKLPEKADQDRQLIQQLPGWHLMGVAQKNIVPVKTEIPEDAPDTRLKLTLRGALASDDPVNARAIIADPRGQDEKYAIGDALPGNAELSEIYPDRVILKRSGRYETLRLPEDAKSPGRQPTAQITPRARQRPGISPQSRLAQVRQQAQQNPRSMAGLIRTRSETGADGQTDRLCLITGQGPRYVCRTRDWLTGMWSSRSMTWTSASPKTASRH